MTVKKALYQDGPHQRGDTPPTAAQWLSEEARAMRRQARRRIYREYTLPVIRRFAYIFSKRGQLPPIKIDGNTIAVEYVSPLSRASDVDEVTRSIELARSALGVFGEQAVAYTDVGETMKNWKDKMSDTTLIIRDEPEQPIQAQPGTASNGQNV